MIVKNVAATNGKVSCITLYWVIKILINSDSTTPKVIQINSFLVSPPNAIAQSTALYPVNPVAIVVSGTPIRAATIPEIVAPASPNKAALGE
ncbi:MAG: hypothetical protein UZ09_BCD002002596 [Bacteroidetes bacterium OLB9]|nr:MAG: hypothetical protein UZ09_BCD002002596 [Bacteroidetes bacterium OLB9]